MGEAKEEQPVFQYVRAARPAAVLVGAALLLAAIGLRSNAAAALAQGAAETGPLSDRKPQLLVMGDNAWLKLNPPREPIGRNYSGACVGDGKVWYWGGGHFSYDGNDVELYDPATNTWTRSYEPEHAGWPQRWKISPREGSPAARHTYQQVCWVPKRKVFFYVPGIDTWQWDPTTSTWTCLTGLNSKSKKFSPKPQAIQTAHCFYSPDLEAPVAIMTTGDSGIYVYDFAKGEWIKRGKDLPLRWQEIYSTYVASRKFHLVAPYRADKPPWMFAYDARSDQWTPLEDVPDPLRGCNALAYDSANDIVLAIPLAAKGGELSVWLMRPATLKWEELKPVGPRPKGNGLWAPLWYVPTHNVFFFLNRTSGTTCETWAYRYRRSPAPASRPANLETR
jgi:hypothetical protein